MAMLGILCTMSRVWAMAWAAMAAVEKVATVDCTISLPSWNMAFSTPVGTPTRSTVPITALSGRMLR